MKKIVLIASILSLASLAASPPPLPGKPAAPAKKVLMSPKAAGSITAPWIKPKVQAAPSPVTGAATSAAVIRVLAPPNVVRDSHVIGYQPVYGFWNGTGFDVPVNPSWVQIFVPNPTQSSFVKVDWSPDLMQWLTIGYFTNYTRGILLVDPSAVGVPKRFYRVQALTP
jgi:hypothetical protein